MIEKVVLTSRPPHTEGLHHNGKKFRPRQLHLIISPKMEIPLTNSNLLSAMRVSCFIDLEPE